MTSSNSDPNQPANTQHPDEHEDESVDRKLTVIGQHKIIPAPPKTAGEEVIRDLVIPKPPDNTSKPDNLRSPD